LPTQVLTKEYIDALPPQAKRELLSKLKQHQQIKARAPYLLYIPYKGWQRDFYEHPARIRLAHCGNRTGKSYGIIGDAVQQMYKCHPFHKEHDEKAYMRIRVVCEDEEHGIDEWVKTLKEFIPPGDIKRDYIPGKSKTRKLSLTDDKFGPQHYFEFMTYSQEVRQFESVEREIIIFDEVPPRQIYTACLTRIMAGGGTMMIGATPATNTMDPGFFRELVESISEMDDADGAVFCGSMYDAARAGVVAYTESDIEKMKDGLSENEIQIRIYGQPINVGGLVFTEFRDRYFTDDPPGHKFDPETLWPGDGKRLPGIPPPDWQIVAGLDPSVNGHTACLWCAISPLNERYYFHEYYERNRIIQQHAEAVLAEEKRFGQRSMWRVIDPAAQSQTQTDAGFETVQDLYLRHGLDTITDNSLRNESARIEKCQHALLFMGPEDGKRPAIFISRHLRHFIHQLRHVSYQQWRDPEQHNEKQKVQDKDNHLTDCFGYIEAMNPQYIKADAIEPMPVMDSEIGY